MKYDRRVCVFMVILSLLFPLHASSLNDELTNKIEQLSDEKPFVNFSLQLTPKEQALPGKIITNRNDEYNYYGTCPQEKKSHTFCSH